MIPPNHCIRHLGKKLQTMTKSSYSKWIIAFTFSVYSFALWAKCIPDGQWLIPESGTILSSSEFFTQLPNSNLILLGEHHANSDHHTWQLNVLKKLHQQQTNMVIALEMIPRRLQTVLDQWVHKTITKAQFIELIEWEKIFMLH